MKIIFYIILNFLLLLNITGCDTGQASYSLDDITPKSDINKTNGKSSKDLDINGSIILDKNSSLIVTILPLLNPNTNVNPNVNPNVNDVVTKINFIDIPNIDMNITIEGDDKSFFRIDNDLNIYFIKIPYYNPAEDYDENNIYEISILIKTKFNEVIVPLKITISEDYDRVLPVIISSTHFINENSNNIQIIAETSNSSSLNFNLLDNNDSELFSITNDGVLIFNDIPNYEYPLDSNSDNTYNITVEVTDTTIYNNSVIKDITIYVESINEGIGAKDITYNIVWNEINNNLFNVGKNYKYIIEIEPTKQYQEGEVFYEILDFDETHKLNNKVFSINSNYLTIDVPNWISLRGSTKTYYIKIKIYDEFGNYSFYKLVLNAS